MNAITVIILLGTVALFLLAGLVDTIKEIVEKVLRGDKREAIMLTWALVFVVALVSLLLGGI